MSRAWEVTSEDVEIVLAAHGIGVDVAEAASLAQECDDRVTNAVLYYCDFETQTLAAASEIEDFLIEKGLISGPKEFEEPQ